MVEIADLDYPNQFFDELLPSSWPTHEEDEEVHLENLNINEIEDGGAVEQFNKSFYTYMGSQTTFPCAEGVRRIVFTNTIKVQES